jgi:hypothetical protein
MNTKNKSFIFVIIILFVGFLIYWYPVQKYMAKNAVEQYMEKQGISVDNVDGKHIMKDYKQGGYEIDVVLKDDPGLVYAYYWRPKRAVVLIVYVDGNAGIDEGMKYPPLEK